MATASLTDLARAAERFHALADPTRLAILERLRHGEHCVCELTSQLDAAQSRLSFHLRVLKEAGLVHDEQRGRWIYYSLCAETMNEVENAAAALRPLRTTRGRSAKCCE